jgi:hypothetical protein
MARFLQDRSCNDDFVPITRITRSTCAPNRLEQASYVTQENNTNPYADANIYFKEKKNILSWEADPRLEAIDLRLEQICAAEEKRLNGDGYDGVEELGEREDFCNDSIRVEDFDLHYYHYQTLILSGMKKQNAKL